MLWQSWHDPTGRGEKERFEPEIKQHMKHRDSNASRIPKVILMIESSRESGRALLCGVANYAHHHGPWSFYWEAGGLDQVWPMLKGFQAEGIILRDVDKLDEVLAFGIPAVVVGHSRGEVPNQVNVVTDSQQVGRLAADHLLGCGFKHFAFCGYADTPDETTSWSSLRHRYFSAHIQEAGFAEPFTRSLSMVSRDWSDQLRLLAQWLASLPKPVGLMACNDDCSRLVMEACKLAGLAVPDDVGVVGADNDEVVCGLADPPMSSVAINFERAGYEAAHALHGLMRRKRAVPRKITVAASHVVARRSTDFVAAEEVHLAKALRFIRDRARGPLAVDEVARAAGLSRRALEKRFRQLLGRSVLEEIRRARTDQIARLLVETDMPVAQIADLLGFVDVQHVARYFRSAKKMSPIAYRKAFGSKQLSLTGAQNGDSLT